jgi:acyl carrier protein
MKGKSLLIALVAMLAFVFMPAQFLGAQELEEVEELDEFLEEIDELESLDYAGLLLKLSENFGVEVEELEALIAEGRSPGELWLALEISQISGISLADAILLTDGTEGSAGHGWGVLAKMLGMDPGSAEFHDLKGTWGKSKDNMVQEMKEEKLGKISMEQNKEKNASETPERGSSMQGNENSGQASGSGKKGR